MKILMLGDFSNLHACLAKELKKRGHDVTLVSDKGIYMKTDADVELMRKPGIWGSVRYLYRILALLPTWAGYDVVQLINPTFVFLKASKLRIIFDILKKNNKNVFLTLCSNDSIFVKDCVDGDMFRFSEFRVGKEKTPFVKNTPWRETRWLIPAYSAYTAHLYECIDGAMSILPEYDISARQHMDPKKIAFTNLPIELDSLKYSELNFDGPVRILVGMKIDKEAQKGTDRLLEICKSIEREMPGECEVKAVKNLALSDYLEEVRKSHIVVDQLYSYSPATNALQTMAMGRISVSGGQPEYYDYIGESSHPIFCVSPLEDDDTIKNRLKSLILDKKRMKQMSEEGRKLVKKYHDVKNIAPLFEQHWMKIMKDE